MVDTTKNVHTKTVNWMVCTKNGMKMVNYQKKCTYRDGKLDGEFEKVNDDGTRESCIYVRGTKIGPYNFWAKNGKLLAEGVYYDCSE